MRDAPAEVDEVKPEFFGDGGVGAEPGFEDLVGGLPVAPLDSGFINGASVGAEVVNIERF